MTYKIIYHKRVPKEELSLYDQETIANLMSEVTKDGFKLQNYEWHSILLAEITPTKRELNR